MQLYANSALLVDGWAEDVLIDIRRRPLSGFERGRARVPDGARAASAGPVIPGMANVHSHAFQRGFAGLRNDAGPARTAFGHGAR